MSDLINIAILGASGFVGGELIKLCANHRHINIKSLSANSLAGHDAKIKNKDISHLKYQLIEDIDFKNIDFIFNCLPNKKMHLLIKNLPSNIRIIDLSADFRLDEVKDYETWYNFIHNSGNKIKEFTYGLSELNRNKIKDSKNISNPGCYATSVLVPLLPLIKNNLIKVENIIIDAKSGYSGAGKTTKTKDLLKEVKENIKTYGVGDHSHISEINQEMTKLNSNKLIEVFFSANLIPVERGILSNIYISPRENVDFDDLYNCLDVQFKNEIFVSLLPENEIPVTKDVVNTNKIIIGLKKGYKSNVFCIVSVLDNLVKGAAGQAMQNFNIMNNFNEGLGIQ